MLLIQSGGCGCFCIISFPPVLNQANYLSPPVQRFPLQSLLPPYHPINYGKQIIDKAIVGLLAYDGCINGLTKHFYFGVVDTEFNEMPFHRSFTTIT